MTDLERALYEAGKKFYQMAGRAFLTQPDGKLSTSETLELLNEFAVALGQADAKEESA